MNECEHHFESDGGPCMKCGLTMTQLVNALFEPEIKPGKSNIEMITDFMQFGSAMNQIFVIEAISRYAAQIVEHKKQVLHDMQSQFVSGEAWVQCAEDWQTLLANDPRRPR